MRKKISIFLLSFLLVGAIGCATESSNSNITITPTITISSSVVENEEKDAKEMPTSTIKNETNDSTQTPIPTKASSSVFLTIDTKQKEMITKTDGLCEQLEQIDASVQASYNSFNRMLSTDSELFLSGQSLFCIDESTGVIYFVNYGKDYYLYRLKDGEVKLAVAMPIKQIYTYQGAVYFMIDSYDIYELGEIHSGDIYCYTPANGTVELIYEAGAIENSQDHRLTVNEEGIYFSYTTEEEKINKKNFYYLPFGESEPIEDTKMTTWKGWDNYVFDMSNEWVLASRTKQEDGTRETIPLSNRKIRFCVKGDYLYSAERTYVSCLNLKTGEETKYDFLEAIQENTDQYTIEQEMGNRIIESFTVTETDIWITTNGQILYRLDLQTKELSYCKTCKDKNAISSCYTIQELYTDGKQLYALCASSEEVRSKGWEYGYFARINTDIVEKNYFDNEVMLLEVLVE